MGVMVIEVPRMKRFLEEGRIEEEKESVLPFVGEERIGETCTLRNDTVTSSWNRDPWGSLQTRDRLL